MGETYRTMAHAKRTGDSSYVSDLCFDDEYQNVPNDIIERAKESIFDWREGESAYVFEKDGSGISLKVSYFFPKIMTQTCGFPYPLQK